MADKRSSAMDGVDWTIFSTLLLLLGIGILVATGGHPLVLVSLLVGAVVACALIDHLTAERGWAPPNAAAAAFGVFVAASALAGVVIIIGLIALVIWILKQLGGGGTGGSSSKWRRTGKGKIEYEEWKRKRD